MLDVLLVIAAVIIAALRFKQPAQPLSWTATYQAAAHLLVGGLIGAAIVYWPAYRDRAWFCWELVICLSAIELYCFFKGRMKKKWAD